MHCLQFQQSSLNIIRVSLEATTQWANAISEASCTGNLDGCLPMHGLSMFAAAQQGRKRAAEQNKATIAATWRMDGACQWKHGRGWKWTKHSIAPCHKHEPLSTCRMGNSARVESNGNGIAKKCVCHGKHTQHKIALCLLPSATMVNKRCEGPTFPTTWDLCQHRNAQHSKQCKQHVHPPQWCQPFWAFNGNMEHTSKALIQ